MKKIYLLLFILIFVACSDQLDKDPYGVVSTSNFYKTAQDAEMAVTSAYKSFQLLDGQQGWNTRAGYTPMGDVTGPDAQAHPDLVVYYQIQQSIVMPSVDQMYMLYSRCYKALTLTNMALQKIPEIEMDEQLKSRYLGELYFIRGFWMFRLAYMFGTAPLVNKVLDISELNLPSLLSRQTLRSRCFRWCCRRF